MLFSPLCCTYPTFLSRIYSFFFSSPHCVFMHFFLRLQWLCLYSEWTWNPLMAFSQRAPVSPVLTEQWGEFKTFLVPLPATHEILYFLLLLLFPFFFTHSRVPLAQGFIWQSSAVLWLEEREKKEKKGMRDIGWGGWQSTGCWEFVVKTLHHNTEKSVLAYTQWAGSF